MSVYCKVWGRKVESWLLSALSASIENTGRSFLIAVSIKETVLLLLSLASIQATNPTCCKWIREGIQGCILLAIIWHQFLKLRLIKENRPVTGASCEIFLGFRDTNFLGLQRQGVCNGHSVESLFSNIRERTFVKGIGEAAWSWALTPIGREEMVL